MSVSVNRPHLNGTGSVLANQAGAAQARSAGEGKAERDGGVLDQVDAAALAVDANSSIQPQQLTRKLSAPSSQETIPAAAQHQDNQDQSADGGLPISDAAIPADLEKALRDARKATRFGVESETANAIEHIGSHDPAGAADRRGADPQAIFEHRRKSSDYAQTYLPSDTDLNDAAGAAPHRITKNEAMSELYRYAESLPGNIDLLSLQRIVDGTSQGRKLAPQLRAAAQYFVSYPHEWKNLVSQDGRRRDGGAISNEQLQQALSEQINLSQKQRDVVATLKNHQELFFFNGGCLDRNTLRQIAADAGSAPPIANAARTLLADRMLFGMLDNGMNGHLTSTRYTTDDGVIRIGDVEGFLDKSRTKNILPPAPPRSVPIETADAAEALREMAGAIPDQPAPKQPRHTKTLVEQATDGLGRFAGSVLEFAQSGWQTLATAADGAGLVRLAVKNFTFSSRSTAVSQSSPEALDQSRRDPQNANADTTIAAVTSPRNAHTGSNTPETANKQSRDTGMRNASPPRLPSGHTRSDGEKNADSARSGNTAQAAVVSEPAAQAPASPTPPAGSDDQI